MRSSFFELPKKMISMALNKMQVDITTRMMKGMEFIIDSAETLRAAVKAAMASTNKVTLYTDEIDQAKMAIDAMELANVEVAHIDSLDIDYETEVLKKYPGAIKAHHNLDPGSCKDVTVYIAVPSQHGAHYYVIGSGYNYKNEADAEGDAWKAAYDYMYDGRL